MSATVAKGVDKRSMTVLSAGHLFIDVNQGAVAALIPFLIAERGISLAAAGSLVLAATVSSSLVQPLFGIFSDRRPLPVFMPLGLLLGGAGIALAGVAPSFLLIFLCVVASGIGVAAFHPEGARFANYVSGSGRARGMSFFSVGGNAGFALGPVFTTPLVLLFGLPGTLFLALPAAVMAGVLFAATPRLLRFGPEPAPEGEDRPEQARDAWGPFTVMVGVVTARSFVYFGLVTFVAEYYNRVFGESAAFGNAALSVMLFSGAVGTLLLGGLADRVGRRAVLLWSMVIIGPLTLGFTFAGPIAGVVLLGLIGAATIGTFGVTVVMGQEYLPGRIGLAAGVTMGLSIGLGGISAPLLGFLADARSLETTMFLISGFPVLGVLLCLFLPRKAPPEARDA